MGYVTVTDVRVSGDLHNASVYYTVLGNQTERQDTQSALAAATGMLRSEVGRNITAKLTPSLEFIMDGVPENAIVIENLLQEARKRDAEVGRQKTSARYAGDEQPYKVPQTNDEN
jgi:ribosome-binding factor A